MNFDVLTQIIDAYHDFVQLQTEPESQEQHLPTQTNSPFEDQQRFYTPKDLMIEPTCIADRLS